MPTTVTIIASFFISSIRLWHDREPHVHAFVFLAADHRANYYVFAWLQWRDQFKLIQSRLQQQVPSLDLGAVFCTQQCEPVNGAVAIPALSPSRRDAQQQLFTHVRANGRLTLPGDFVTAVLVCRHFDHPRLCPRSLKHDTTPVSYTHLRAHETPEHLV